MFDVSLRHFRPDLSTNAGMPFCAISWIVVRTTLWRLSAPETTATVLLLRISRTPACSAISSLLSAHFLRTLFSNGIHGADGRAFSPCTSSRC